MSSGPSAALSGWDALHLDGLASAPPTGTELLVLVRTGRSRRVGQVLVRRTDRPYSTRLSGHDHPLLPLTPLAAPARAVADAALPLRDVDAVRGLVAGAVQRRGCSVDDLVAELATAPRGRSRNLRTAVGEVLEGARSAAEANAVAQLRRSRLPDFEVNVPVIDAAGKVIFELDVFWRRFRAVLEIEGREYHFGRSDWHSTLRRHNVLTRGALALVHYPPSSVMRPASGWVGEVESWLRARAAELGIRYIAGSPTRPVRRRTATPWLLG